MDRQLRSDLARAPALRAAMPFMAGLALARWLMPSMAVILAAGVTVGACMLVMVIVRVKYPMRWTRGVLLTLSMLGLGLLWQGLRDPRSDRHALHPTGEDAVLLIELRDPVYIGSSSARYEASLIALREGSSAHEVTGRVYLTLALDTTVAVPAKGDRLWIDTRMRAIDRVPDPGGFDRAAYAAGQGIFLEAYVPVDRWRKAAHRASWTDMFAGARQRISIWLVESGLPARERALAKALLLGLRDELDQDQKTAFARSGTMHVLAVSGMHVGLIFIVFSTLLNWWGERRVPRIVRGVIVLSAIWGYAGLTGAAPSVLRATIMFTLFTLAGMSGRQGGALNSLFMAAFLLLAWDPMMLVQLSFQLSFLAVLGIVLFYKPLLQIWSPPNRVMHHAWSAAAVSVAAQLTTTPLSIWVFKAFPLWFLPANILIVGVVSLAVYGGALLVLLFKVPLIGGALTWCMTQLLLFLGWCTAWFGSLPGAYPGVRIGVVPCIALYLLIGSGAAMLIWRTRALRGAFAVMLVFVLLSWAWSANRTNGVHRFVVHDQRTELVASIQVGRELVLIADSALVAEPWVAGRIEAQQRATGSVIKDLSRWDEVHATGWRSRGPVMFGSGFVSWAGGRARFQGRDIPKSPSGPVPVDVLVLIDDHRYDLEALVAAFTPGALVLSPGINGLERYRVRKWCETARLVCHDLKRQGAFIFER